MTSAPKRLLGADLGRPSRGPRNPWEGLLISDLRRETTVVRRPHPPSVTSLNRGAVPRRLGHVF